MYSKKSKVNFSMTYAHLSSVSKQRANTIMRDIAEFENYGIKSAEIIAFKSKVVDFDNMRIDEDYRGVVMQATQDKNFIVRKIKINIRDIVIFVKQRHSIKAGVFERLKLGSIGKISDLKLYSTTNNFCQVVRSLDIPLANNVIVSRIAELEALNLELNYKIEDKNKKVEERNIAAIKRVSFANEIYSQLLST